MPKEEVGNEEEELTAGYCNSQEGRGLDGLILRGNRTTVVVSFHF